MQRTARIVRSVALACVGVVLLGACGSDHHDASGGGSQDGSSRPTVDFGANTTSTLPAMAARLGCGDYNADQHVDNGADAEGSCRLDGKTVLLWSFPDDASLLGWVARGPQTADNPGTVVVANHVAVAPFDPSQLDRIQTTLGGHVEQMG